MEPGRPFRTTLNPPDVTLKEQGWNQTPFAYGTQRRSSSRLMLVVKCSRLLRFGSRPSVKLLKAVIGMCPPIGVSFYGYLRPARITFSRKARARMLEDRNSKYRTHTSISRQLSFPKPRNTCHDLSCRPSWSIHRCRSSRPCHLTSPFRHE